MFIIQKETELNSIDWINPPPPGLQTLCAKSSKLTRGQMCGQMEITLITQMTRININWTKPR